VGYGIHVRESWHMYEWARHDDFVHLIYV